MAGVIPPIFASSILLFPATISEFFATSQTGLLSEVTMMLSPGQPLYILLFSLAIIFFAFFYTALVYNPQETADTLKKSGAFIPGMRPGDQTAKYIDGVMTRLTLTGALYITFVCLVPQFLNHRLERAIRIWRYFTLDYCCCRYGFNAANSNTYDVVSI